MSTLQDWLRQQLPQAKQTTLRRMLEAGRVRVNGKIAKRMKDPISDNDKIEMLDRPTANPKVIPKLDPIKVLFEDDEIMVIEKPAGLLTSTVPKEKRPTVLKKIQEYLAAKDPSARVGLIHRLDRDASGLLVFSKSDPAYQSLKQQFFKHTVKRVYTAIVHGTLTPRDGRIASRLVETPDGTVRTSQRPGGGELALSDYKTLASEHAISAVRVTLETGKKHQIRVHLSERGNPIVGDTVYGKPDDAAPRLMLAATYLEFIHPRSNKPVKFQIPVPAEFPIKVKFGA